MATRVLSDLARPRQRPAAPADWKPHTAPEFLACPFSLAHGADGHRRPATRAAGTCNGIKWLGCASLAEDTKLDLSVSYKGERVMNNETKTKEDEEFTPDDEFKKKLEDAQVPGREVEFTPEEADWLGAFSEDALTEEEAKEASDDLPNVDQGTELSP